MSLRTRIALLFNMKTTAALDAVEDPREVLDYAYGQQRRQLHTLKQGRVEMATARRLLQRQAQKLRDQAERAEDQARRALRAQREDLARGALERKQTALKELRAVERHIEELELEEARLAHADQQLSIRVDRFKVRRSVLSARSSAAEAQVAAADVFEEHGPSEALELSLAVERAEENVERLGARALSIEELTEATEAPGIVADDPMDRELEDIDINTAVQRELDALRRELRSEEGEQA